MRNERRVFKSLVSGHSELLAVVGAAAVARTVLTQVDVLNDSSEEVLSMLTNCFSVGKASRLAEAEILLELAARCATAPAAAWEKYTSPCSEWLVTARDGLEDERKRKNVLAPCTECDRPSGLALGDDSVDESLAFLRAAWR